MNKIELVEQNETPILLEQDENGVHYAKFLVTTIGARNKNGRVYPMSIAAREAQYSMRGDILGQDTHPTNTPKFTEQFLIWQEFMVEGDKEYARAKIVPTIPDGTNFILLAQAGAMVSCSRRGIGSVKEEKVNGVKAMVVQDDYKLLGIDILPPHTQSDHNAYMYRFEAYDPQEETNMELTLEQLREDHGALVTEIETAISTPLQEKVTELEGQVANLTQEKADAVTLAEDTQKKLDEKLAELDTTASQLAELSVKVETLEPSLAEATAQVATLNESLTARNHLLEKVKGERAAWLILDELKDCPTVAEVNAKFDDAKQKCDALIEHSAPPAGRAQYLANENSEINQQKPEPKVNDVLAKSKRIARFGTQ